MDVLVGCEHFVTQEGNCIKCGRPWEYPKWTAEELQKEWDSQLAVSMDEDPLPENSNIPALCDLADQTWAEYKNRASDNEDPKNPQIPRLRLVGGRLMRIPFQNFFKEVLGISFDYARGLGYLGSYEKWCQFVKRRPANSGLPDPPPASVV